MKYSWSEYLTFLAKLEPNTIQRVELLKAARESKPKEKPPPQLPEYLKLTTISGIGESKAKELVKLGVTYANVRAHLPQLPHESQLFLKYKPITEIPQQIAREVAAKICKKYSTPTTKATVAGSVRRSATFSKDIDIIITNSSGTTQSLPPSLIPTDSVLLSRGENKMAFLVKYKTDYYKIDMYFTNDAEFAFMLLYLTGSKEFNIKMRAHAKARGFLLNQVGLFRGGKRIGSAKTEKEIFAAVGMNYVEPTMR